MSEHQLRASILHYLESAAAASPDDEGYQVAVQLLRESFAVDDTENAAPPPLLLETFTAGLASASAPPQPPPTPAMPAGGFERFVDELTKKGYFAGTMPSDGEYERRIETARTQFAGRFGDGGTASKAGAAVDAKYVAPLASAKGAAPLASAETAATPDAPAAPAADDAVLQMARALLAEGQHDRAIAEVARAVDAADGSDSNGLADLLGVRAIAFVATGQYDGALADAETATALASERDAQARAHGCLALALEGVGRWSQACQAYARAAATQALPGAGPVDLTEPNALLLATRERLVRARGSGAAAPGVPGSAAAAAASRAAAASSGTAASGAASSSGPTSALTLVPAGGSTALGTPQGGFDMNMMSSFLSDPDVLATANRVADQFLEGSPEGANAAQALMASFFGVQAGPPAGNDVVRIVEPSGAAASASSAGAAQPSGTDSNAVGGSSTSSGKQKVKY